MDFRDPRSHGRRGNGSFCEMMSADLVLKKIERVGFSSGDGDSLHPSLPEFSVSVDVRKNVGRSNCKYDLAELLHIAIAVMDFEMRVGLLFDLLHRDRSELNGPVILLNVLPGGSAVILWTLVIPGQDHVHVVSAGVAVGLVIIDNSCVNLTSKRIGCSETCRSSADDGDIDEVHYGWL